MFIIDFIIFFEAFSRVIKYFCLDQSNLDRYNYYLNVFREGNQCDAADVEEADHFRAFYGSIC